MKVKKRQGGEDPKKYEDRFLRNNGSINTGAEFDSFVNRLRKDFGGSFVNQEFAESIKAARAEFDSVGSAKDSPKTMALLKKAAGAYYRDIQDYERQSAMKSLKRSPGGYNTK